MPCLELVTFTVNADFLANPDVIRSNLDTLCKTDGCLSVYHGIQTEDKKTGYMAIVWETYEHHAAMMKAPDYGEFYKSISRGIEPGTPVTIQHHQFEGDPSIVLGAAVTEIIVISAKPESIETVEPHVKALAEAFKKTDACRNLSLWGETREQKGIWVFSIGWESIQAHLETVKGNTFQTLTKGILASAEASYKHVSFTHHTV